MTPVSTVGSMAAMANTQQWRVVSMTLREAHADNTSFVVGTSCDSIRPALVAPDGTPVYTDKGQRADGFEVLVSRGPATARSARRYFVPLANVAGLTYGLEDAK